MPHDSCHYFYQLVDFRVQSEKGKLEERCLTSDLCPSELLTAVVSQPILWALREEMSVHSPFFLTVPRDFLMIWIHLNCRCPNSLQYSSITSATHRSSCHFPARLPSHLLPSWLHCHWWPRGILYSQSLPFLVHESPQHGRIIFIALCVNYPNLCAVIINFPVLNIWSSGVFCALETLSLHAPILLYQWSCSCALPVSLLRLHDSPYGVTIILSLSSFSPLFSPLPPLLYFSFKWCYIILFL